MKIRKYLAQTTPVLWFSLMVLAALTAAGAPQAKHPAPKTPVKGKAKTSTGSKSAAKKAPQATSKSAAGPAPRVIPAIIPSGLAGMVKVYRDSPTAARREVLENYAASH